MGKYYDRLVKMNESLDVELHAKGIDVSTANRVDNTNNASKNGKNEVVMEDGDEAQVPVPADSLTDNQKKGILSDTLKDAGLKVDDKVIDELVKNPDEMAGVQKILGDEQKNESGAVELSDIDWDGPAILKYDNPNEPDFGGFYVTDKDWSSDVKRATEFDSKEAAQEKLDELAASGKFDGDYLYIWSAKSKFDEDADVNEEVVIRMDDDDLEMHGFVKSHDGDDMELTEDMSEAERFQHEELGNNVIEAICYKFHYDPSTFSTVSVDPEADEPYEDDNEVNIDDGETWVSLDPLDSQATTLAD